MIARLALSVLLLPGLAAAQAPKAKPKPRPKPKAPAAAAAPAKSTETAQGLPLLSPPTGPVTVDMVIARFEEFDGKVKTLAAEFTQSIRMEEAGTQQSVEGTLEYGKPNLLRIEHSRPERQTIVADGTWLWVWRRENNQVVQTKLEDWKKSEPLAEGLMDFGNYAKLLRTYSVAVATVSAPGPDGHRDLELVLRPKEKPSAFSLTMRLSTANFFPSQTELRTGAVAARTTFSNIKYNPSLAESRFQFTPPPDADVFQNFKPPRTQ